MNSRAARRRSWTRTATESSSSKPRICIPTKTGCRRRRSTSSSSRNSMPARGASRPARSAGRRRKRAGRRRRGPRRKRVPRKGDRRKRRPDAHRKGPPRSESPQIGPQRDPQRKKPVDVAVKPAASAWDGFRPGHSLPTGRRATMTTCSLLARTSRRLPLLSTSSALVVALLLLFSGRHVSADAGIPLASASLPRPPLPATSVVVFLPRGGRLAGTIEGVDVADGKFTMFYRAISTNSATTWSGVGPNGPVKGIGDLVAGMYATVAVVASSGGLLAASVDAIGFVTPPHLIAFRGPVQTISPTQWQIAGRVVQVDSDTKIVGDPKVGDIVDVVALVHDPLPGSLAPSYLVAVSITKAPAITPPPGDRATEFDGIVESIPTAPTANGAPLGHWEISSRDVIVNGLTKLDTGIIVGSAVHVKGPFVMASAVVGSLSSTQFVATEITKK